MKALRLVIVVLFLFFISCKESGDSNSTSGTSTSSDVVTQRYSPTGYAQDGPCLSGGDVTIQTLYSDDLRQTSEIFTTTTESNFGFYDASRVMRSTSYQYALITIEAACFNELTNSVMSTKTFKALVDLNSSEENNINPLTTIIVDRQIELYRDSSSIYYQNFDTATTQAEKETFESVFNIYGITDHFRDMSLNNRNGSTLLAANVIMLEGRSTVAEQESFMNTISVALRDNSVTTSLTNAILVSSQNISLTSVKTNLEARYLSLGETMTAPGFWEKIDSNGNGILNSNDSDKSIDYRYITGDIKIVDHVGMNGPDTITSNSSRWYSYWATPYVFDSSDDISYIMMNTSGDYVSIYSNNDVGDGVDSTNDQPLIALKTVSVESVNQFLGMELTDSSGDSFRNFPAQSIAKIEFTPTAGVKYWIVNHCSSIYKPYIGDGGDDYDIYGGRALSDDGSNWKLNINYNNHRIAFIN